jgi:DNA-directed RNA polymerase delta subunit
MKQKVNANLIEIAHMLMEMKIKEVPMKYSKLYIIRT